MKWPMLIVLVLLLVSAGGPCPVVAAVPEDSAPAGFQIPSAEELGGNDTIATYRAQYTPKYYNPESPLWPVIDIGMLAAIIILGGVLVWRHVHSKWFWIPAALTLLYFGFVRGGCICPVGSVANVAIGLRHPEKIGVSTAIMFFLPLVAAFIMGRVFCVAGCPLGAVQHLMGGKRSVRIPAALERGLRLLPVLALVSTAWLALRGSCLLVCILDPYKTAFFFGYGWIHRIINLFTGGFAEPGLLYVGDLTAWSIFAGAIVLGFWVYRPFCRFVCPYGVLLGLLSMVALKRRHIDQVPCVQCGICEKHCPVHAITRDPVSREFSISSFHCIQCNRCLSRCRKNGIT